MKILEIIFHKARKFVLIDDCDVYKYTSIIYIIDVDMKVNETLRNLDVDNDEWGYTNTDLELSYCADRMMYTVSTIYMIKKFNLNNVDFDTASKIVIENGGVINELSLDQFNDHLTRLGYP